MHFWSKERKKKLKKGGMVIAKERRIRTRKSGTVLAAALALVMMPIPARTFVAPVLLPTSVLSQHLCTQRRANQLQDTARNLHALATSGGIKVGDRVEILVKTVSFSKKLMANNLSSRDLTGVVKFVTCPEEPTDLAMATIEFRKPDGSEAFEHLFAEDEVVKVVAPADGVLAAAAANRDGLSGRSALTSVNLVVSTSDSSDKMSELSEILTNNEGLAVNKHSMGLTLRGSWGSVITAISKCEAVMGPHTLLSLTITAD